MFRVQKERELQRMPKEKDDLLLKYQKIYAEDVHSRVFAPLAEAYRKRGKIEEALQICQNGIKRHAHFVGAYITLGRIYLDSQKEREACKCFIKAVQLAPENLLAHSLLARCWLRLNQSQKALKSLKTILFLNPNNPQIQKAITQLENSTAHKHEESLFAFLPDAEKKIPPPTPKPSKEEGLGNVEGEGENRGRKPSPLTQPLHEGGGPRELEKFLSLIDALISLGRRDKALAYLEKMEEKWPQNKEVQVRRKTLTRSADRVPLGGSSAYLKRKSPQEDKEDQIRKLENLLLKIQNKRM